MFSHLFLKLHTYLERLYAICLLNLLFLYISILYSHTVNLFIIYSPLLCFLAAHLYMFRIFISYT